jgi:chromosome partitioning protein
MSDNKYLSVKEALDYLKERYDYSVSKSTFARHYNDELKLVSLTDGGTRLFTTEALDDYYKYRNVKRVNNSAEIITFANHKGGVGKTVSVLNAAAGFAKFFKHRILVIDFDPQANLSSSYDIDLQNVTTVDEVIMDDEPIENAIIEINEFIDIVPSYKSLCDFDLKPNTDSAIYHLSNALDKIRGNYDFIFIDCPPQISKLTYSSIIAGDHLFIPMKPDMFSVDGLVTFLEYAKGFNENIKIQGIFITQFAKTQVLDNEYKSVLEEYYPDLLMDTVIRKNIAVSESVVQKQNIFDYDQRSSGAIDYKLLVYEMHKKMGY